MNREPVVAAAGPAERVVRRLPDPGLGLSDDGADHRGRRPRTGHRTSVCFGLGTGAIRGTLVGGRCPTASRKYVLVPVCWSRPSAWRFFARSHRGVGDCHHRHVVGQLRRPVAATILGDITDPGRVGRQLGRFRSWGPRFDHGAPPRDEPVRRFGRVVAFLFVAGILTSAALVSGVSPGVERVSTVRAWREITRVTLAREQLGWGWRARAGKPPTLRDVAREAGVHVSTVSRVLNDRAAAGRITQDTERRIRDVAEGWVTGRTPSPVPSAPDGLSSSGWSSPTWRISIRRGSPAAQAMSSPRMATP